MTIAWTKGWSASDDGTILGGNDIGNIQSDIESETVHIAGSQTITGNKTFSGVVTVGSSIIIDMNDFVYNSGNSITYDDNAIYYTV